MISIRPIFQGSFWFDLFPSALSPLFERGFFFLFAAIVFAGAALRIIARRSEYDRDQKLIMRTVATACTVMGLAGLVWLFFTYQEVYLFGARFWFLIWLAIAMYVTYRLVRFARVDVPAMKEARNIQKEINEYLPKKRRRKGKK
jgi:amino acid transporter